MAHSLVFHPLLMGDPESRLMGMSAIMLVPRKEGRVWFGRTSRWLHHTARAEAAVVKPAGIGREHGV